MLPPAAPDEPHDASSGSARQETLSTAEASSRKAKLDDAELNVGVPKALQKVDLDLDGAPFLEEPAEVQQAPEVPSAPMERVEHIEEFAEKPPVWKQRKFQFLGGGVLLILLAVIAWLVMRAPAPPPPPPLEAPAPAPAPAPPVPSPPKEVQESFYVLEPFLVEKTDEKGHIRLITLKLKLGYKDEKLAQELKKKNLVLRDGLYYNLKNKTFTNLTDKKTVDALREELKGVVDNYLNTGQVQEVLFDDLLVK